MSPFDALLIEADEDPPPTRGQHVTAVLCGLASGAGAILAAREVCRLLVAVFGG